MRQFDELPEKWEESNLGEIAEIIMGQSPPGDSYNQEGEGIPLINGPVEFGTSPFSKTIRSKFTTNPTKFCESGDLILCVRGSTTGRMNIAGFRACIGRGVAAIRYSHCQNYLNLFIHANRDNIYNLGTGSTFPNVSANILSQIHFPLPPLNEQRRIVEKIEALTARSRKARAALDEIPALLDQFRQSVLAAAFRGDLTADWRAQNPNVEPAEALLDRIRVERRKCWEVAELEKMRAKGKEPKNDKWKEKYQEPQEVEGSSKLLLPELPEGWLWLSADACTSWITDGEHATPERSDSGIYLLSARNVLDGRLSLEKVDFIAEEVHARLENRLKILPGDVLLSCSGTVGRSCVAPTDISFSLVRSVAVLKPLLKMGNYLSLALRSPYLQAQIERKKTQTAQSNLFQGRIKVLAVPVAPIQEQQKILQVVEDVFQLIAKVEQKAAEISSNNQFLDQSILAKAFRGKLVPQDPNDESAVVLLDRIRAERERLGSGKKRGKAKA